MSESKDELTLYIRLRKSITVRKGTEITLGMIAHLVCDPKLDQQFREFVLIPKEEAAGEKTVIDFIHIIRKLRRKIPGITIEYFGEPQTLILFKAKEQKPRILFAIVVWLILFIGSGLAIMNFHTDVSMPEVHQNLYRYITGEFSEFPLLLQIPYSFGLGIGMVLFFNRVFKRKLNEEPDPLELEMYNYRNNIYQYSITEELEKQGGPNRHDD